MGASTDQPVDIREQIARIDLAQAETRKYGAEQSKLAAEQSRLAAEAGNFAAEQIARIEVAQAEARKFAAEQNKLAAEAAKITRDRWLPPVLAIVTVLGGLAGFASAVVTALRLAH